MYKSSAVLKTNFSHNSSLSPFSIFVNSVKNYHKFYGAFELFLDKDIFTSHNFSHERFINLLEYLYHPQKNLKMTIILNNLSDNIIKNIFYHMTYTHGRLIIDNIVESCISLSQSKQIYIKNILALLNDNKNQYKLFTLVLSHNKLHQYNIIKKGE